jgi:hypothetical protein
MKKKKVKYEIRPRNTTRGKWRGDWKYKQDLQLDPTFFNAQL